MKKLFSLPVTTVFALCALGVVAFVFYPRLQSGVGADPFDLEQVEIGRKLYATACASCHGVNLEGQPNWRSRLTSGGLPAPPHDESGHTWHHPDELLFRLTKLGPKAYNDPSIVSNMPAFGGQLSDDEIWAVLAYIKSKWPTEIRNRQAEISRRASG
jgi:mono/diheme cytochrome c family protein